MKRVILSDIHGSYDNLRRVFDVMGDEMNSSQIFILGDIYNHGPRNPLPEGYAPMEVAALLNANKDRIIAVRGNCDSEVDEMISEFAILPEYVLFENGRRYLFTHGHKCNPDLPREGFGSSDAVFYGHFHTQSVAKVNGASYICVGAVGMCKPSDVLSFAVLDGNDLQIKAVKDGSVLIEKII